MVKILDDKKLPLRLPQYLQDVVIHVIHFKKALKIIIIIIKTK